MAPTVVPSSRPSSAQLTSSKPHALLNRTPVLSTPKYTPSAFSTPPSVPSTTRPLIATKVVAGASTSKEGRRSVAFSGKNETKLFTKDSPIVPESAPPPSIRSYNSPISSPLLASSSERGSSPTRHRPILKAIDKSSIRVARTVREGSWANRESARRLVVGNHPRGMARTTSTLAQLCGTAEDGLPGKMPPSDDEVPGSDDSNAEQENGGEESDEEPEEVECLHPTSLVSVILEGAEDLLTLEEAYTTLTTRLRDVLANVGLGPVTEEVQRHIADVTDPIVLEAPALVRAITRDIRRLLGKVPQSEQTGSSTPFRGLQPETRPTGLPPSPLSTPTKKGYSAAEIRYRREAASVGAAVLRFLAAVFNSPRLYSAFTEADLISLLEQVVMIPRTPVLPTPTPKRTYSFALTVLSHLRFPPSWVAQVKDKIVTALDSAWNTLGNGGPPYAFKDSGAVKREAFQALSSLIRTYPDIMIPEYNGYLKSVLKGLSSSDSAMRRCASSALSSFVKMRSLYLANAEQAVRFGGGDVDLRAEWEEACNLVRNTERFAAKYLQTVAAPPRRSPSAADKRDGRRYEWTALEMTFKDLIGKQEEVTWACSTWAMLITLIGATYNSFGLGASIDYIMDRSLQASSNSVRPALACAAWQHAIHAYLLAGSSCSIADDGRLVRSFQPFIASNSMDVGARVQWIMFPFQAALKQALNPQNVTKAVVELPEFRNEKRWTWKRSEKARKSAWMITSGGIAAALVYAYTVLALAHEEPTAKEVSRMSGLPSSDGVVADLTPEEQRLPRLDQTFDLVLSPILKQSFPVCGVDQLKNHAWLILEAITADPRSPPPRNIDRLLSARYLNGDITHLEATNTTLTQDMVRAFEGDRIRPSEIPAWGKLWVAKRLGKLLALFLDAFDGIGGISGISSVDWVRNADGIVLLPQSLSRVWTNLLRAMTITQADGAPTPLFKAGLQAITKTLIDIFDRDPVSYMPICLLNEAGESTLSCVAVRLGVVRHLFGIAEDVLGERVLASVHFESPLQPLAQDDDNGEAFGDPTVAGYLLKHILVGRVKMLSSQSIDEKTHDNLMELIASLFKIGSSQNTRMLGHVANTMPWIFENNERLQLDVWRNLASAWIDAIDLQPANAATKTNYTGDLLVSLLSCPFRNTSPDSVWYTAATPRDLDAWNSLLRTTVQRFRAKRVGSNFGVLETLAAHFEDFINISDDEEASARRLAAPTTLSCLAVAADEVSLVPTEHYHASHFSINENYIPADFLGFVASALDAAHPSGQPAAVGRLVTTISEVFRKLPADSVSGVLEPLQASLAKWMSDEDVSHEALVERFDDLYVAVLNSVALAIENGTVDASTETVNNLFTLFAGRLSCPGSAKVPTAFQDFWRRSFQTVSGLEYSDELAQWLRDVIAAVPGLIIVVGLSSDAESQATADRFPFAESVPSQVVETEPVPAESEHAESDDVDISLSLESAAPSPAPPLAEDLSTGYDADVSQTQSKRRPKRKADDIVLDSSPQTGRKDVDIVPESSPQSSAGSPDVFGPNKRTKAQRRKRTKASRSREASRPSSPIPEDVGNDTVILGTFVEDNDPTPTRTNESIFGRLIRKAGSLFAPGESPEQERGAGPSSWEISPSAKGKQCREAEEESCLLADEEEEEGVQPTAKAEKGVEAEPAVECEEVIEEQQPEEELLAVPEIVVENTEVAKAPSKKQLSRKTSVAESGLTDDSQSLTRRRSRRVAHQEPEIKPTRFKRSKGGVDTVVFPAVPPRAPSPVQEGPVSDPVEPAAEDVVAAFDPSPATRSGRRKRSKDDEATPSRAKRQRASQPAATQPTPQNAKAGRKQRRRKGKSVEREASPDPLAIGDDEAMSIELTQVEPEEVATPSADIPKGKKSRWSVRIEPIHEVTSAEEKTQPEDEDMAEQAEELVEETPERTRTQVPEIMVEETRIEDGPIDLTFLEDDDEDDTDIFKVKEEPGLDAVFDSFEGDSHESEDSQQELAPVANAADTTIIADSQPQPRDVTPDRAAPAPEVPPTPSRRTADQARLLETLGEVVADESKFADLDYDGVVELLAYADRLRDIATANLQAQAQEARRLRRTRTL